MTRIVEALRRGSAALSVEFGDQGVADQEEINFAVKGIINVMRTIGMLKGTATVTQKPVYLKSYEEVMSNHSGPAVNRGEPVCIISEISDKP